MRKTIPSPIQETSCLGGSLNLIPMTYKVSDTPIGNEELYGPLAYVTEATRKKIMNAGYGEMQLHIEHIKLWVCLKYSNQLFFIEIVV